MILISENNKIVRAKEDFSDYEFVIKYRLVAVALREKHSK